MEEHEVKPSERLMKYREMPSKPFKVYSALTM